jgi:hypothetical protein
MVLISNSGSGSGSVPKCFRSGTLNAKTGLSAQSCQHRIVRIRQPGQDRQERTAKKEYSEQNKIVRTGQPRARESRSRQTE